MENLDRATESRVIRRLRALTVEQRRLVETAATLPPRFTAEELARELRWRAAELLEPFEAARRAGLLVADQQHLRFTDDLVRQVVRRSGRPASVVDRRRPERGWQSLTEAELKVVRLVAAGASSRDAARELFLSPHTVNSHVRKAFAKLGVHSRVQLAIRQLENAG